MLKINSLWFVIAFLLFTQTISGQDFEWAEISEGRSVYSGVRVITDKDDGVYLLRNFQESVTFSGRTISGSGGTDIALAKYNSLGDLVWVKTAGGSGNDEGLDIAVDEVGNIFITGYFTGKANFENKTISSSGKEDFFIAKYDRNGKCLFARQEGTSETDRAFSISTDSDNQIIITGQSATNGIPNLFISKYNTRGVRIWSQIINITDTRSSVTAVVTDKTNNVYAAGNFYGNTSISNKAFDNTEIISALLPNVFLIKINSSGNLQWVNTLLSDNLDSYLSFDNGITCDAAGNVVLTGGIIGKLKGRGIEANASGYGNQDIFYSSCSPDGVWRWIKISKSDESVYGRDFGASLYTGNNGIIYTSGYFDGTLNLENISVQSHGGLFDSDIYVAALNSDGQFLWVENAGAYNPETFQFNDIASDISVNKSGEIFIAGYVKGEGHFGKLTLNTSGKKDIYISKISTSQNAARQSLVFYEEENFSAMVFPNPAGDEFNINITGKADSLEFFLLDNEGKQVMEIFDGNVSEDANHVITVDITSFLPGMYFLKMVTPSEVVTTKIIFIR